MLALGSNEGERQIAPRVARALRQPLVMLKAAIGLTVRTAEQDAEGPYNRAGADALDGDRAGDRDLLRVVKAMPMRNTKGAIVYYLFFASQNDTGRKIVESIFHKYQTKGAA